MNEELHPEDEIEDELPGDDRYAAEALLNETVHTWESADKTLRINFRKPKGLISMRIARVLGPAQSQNPALVDFHKAACAAVEFWNCDENGNPIPGKQHHQRLRDAITLEDFEYFFSLFRGNDDWLNAYTMDFFQKCYPEMFEALREAAMAGGNPEVFQRITENAQKAEIKKSRARRSPSS